MELFICCWCIAVTKLSVWIVTPSIYITVIWKCQYVCFAGCYSCDIWKVYKYTGRCLFLNSYRCAVNFIFIRSTVTNHSVFIVAPCVYIAVCCYRICCINTGCYVLNFFSLRKRNLYRVCCIFCKSVTKLSVFIWTPCPNFTVIQQCNGEFATTGNHRCCYSSGLCNYYADFRCYTWIMCNCNYSCTCMCTGCNYTICNSCNIFIIWMICKCSVKWFMCIIIFKIETIHMMMFIWINLDCCTCFYCC